MSLTTTLTVRMPLELKDQLAALAYTTSRGQAHLAVEAVKAYLEQGAWQVAEIHEGLREADAEAFATEDARQQFFANWRSGPKQPCRFVGCDRHLSMWSLLLHTSRRTTQMAHNVMTSD
jgi:predicted transcriptional regulator